MIVRNESEAVYHARPEISQSMLKWVLRSPVHFHARFDRAEADRIKDETTEAMLLGKAAHAFALEPDRAAALFVAAPDVDRRTKDGRAKYADAMAAAAVAGASLLTAEQNAAARAIAHSVWSHPVARRLLGYDVETELTVLWTDAPTGLPCRCRVDRAAQSRRIVMDLKTTNDASAHAFVRAIKDRAYHMQAAYYLDGLAASGDPAFVGASDWSWVWLAVETSPPYAVGVYIADDAWILRGRMLYRRALDTVVGLRANPPEDGWPHYTPNDAPAVLDAPAWAIADEYLLQELHAPGRIVGPF